MVKDKWGRDLQPYPTVTVGERSQRIADARAMLDKAHEMNDKDAVLKAQDRLLRATQLIAR